MKTFARGKTHVGRVRKNNQDSICVCPKTHFYIVADGMGGHAGGEVASQMVVDHFLSIPDNELPKEKNDRDIQIFLEKNLNKASAQIYLRSLGNPELKDMGTTCSMVWIHGTKAHCAHAGDSRIYMQRNNFLYQISEDHSLIAEQIKAGLLTESSAKNHALKNVITRSIGYRKEEHIDTFSQELRSGDTLLVCSDGLHNRLSDHMISDVLSLDIKDKHAKLVDLANKHGGDDNISVILVSIL